VESAESAAASDSFLPSKITPIQIQSGLATDEGPLSEQSGLYSLGSKSDSEGCATGVGDQADGVGLLPVTGAIVIYYGENNVVSP